ncbi:hypothetical protein [Pelagibius marinus]|uniref:hypothetical protein n=1 Tax=Pelagibius marinus TaxID=2762760 RepID=UPI001872CD39|nr:hypothetical protein [Pelagibius marinus]
MRRLLLASAALALLTAPAEALDCNRKAESELARLNLGQADITSIRYVQKYNPNENGPDVLGVRAWVRLQACGNNGYLVIDMTRTCFVRQSYTRGECRLESVTAY